MQQFPNKNQKNPSKQTSKSNHSFSDPFLKISLIPKIPKTSNFPISLFKVQKICKIHEIKKLRKSRKLSTKKKWDLGNEKIRGKMGNFKWRNGWMEKGNEELSDRWDVGGFWVVLWGKLVLCCFKLFWNEILDENGLNRGIYYCVKLLSVWRD